MEIEAENRNRLLEAVLLCKLEFLYDQHCSQYICLLRMLLVHSPQIIEIIGYQNSTFSMNDLQMRQHLCMLERCEVIG
jgi:hypothetical protein